MQLLNFFSYVLLLILSIFDIKYKKIPTIMVVLLGGFSIVRVCIGVFHEEITLVSSAFAAFPGILLLICSFCFKDQVGLGDGLVLLLSEIGRDRMYCILSISLVLAVTLTIAIIIVIYDCIKNRRSKRKVPFIPVILSGMILAEVVL